MTAPEDVTQPQAPARPWWRMPLRLLVTTVLVLLAIPVLLFLAGLAINARDEAPSATALALGQPPENPYGADDNLYVGLAGLSAPPGTAVTQYGASRIEQYNQAVSGTSPSDADSKLAPEPPDHVAFRGDVGFAGKPWTSHLFETAPPRAAEVRGLLADNAELMDRYRDLSRRTGYFEDTVPSFPTVLMVFSDVNNIHQLLLAGFTLRLQDPDPSVQREALTQLATDVRIWHRVLTGYGGLLSKAVAIVQLDADELLLADYCARSGSHVPADLETPLFPLSDWDIGSAFGMELRRRAWMLRRLDASAARDSGHRGEPLTGRLKTWWSTRFYQPQATINLFAEQVARFQSMSRPDPANVRLLRQWDASEGQGQSLLGARLAYNPVGRYLDSVFSSALPNFALRASDAAAVQRLVRLAVEIRKQGIAPADVPDFMKRHPEWSTHPGDGRAFQWQPGTNELAVVPVARGQENRRFSVPVFDPAAH